MLKKKTFSSTGGEVHQDRDFGENHIIQIVLI